MKLKAFPFLLFLLFSFPLFTFSQNTLTLKNGKTIKGKLLQQTDRYIKIEVAGVSLTYYLEEIASLDGQPLTFKPTPSTSPSSSRTTLQPTQLYNQASPAVVAIMDKIDNQEIPLGTGFIVDKQGIIITNFHVLFGAQNPFIKLKDSRSYPLNKVIYKDTLRDLIILKIEPQKDLTSLTLGDSDNLSIGEKVYCIGNPVGLEFSLSDGLLSGIRTYDNLKYLQFSAPISNGNSGSPLLNSSGEVIGLVTFGLTALHLDVPIAQNLNFALASNEIKPYLNLSTQLPTLKEIISQAKSSERYYLFKGNEAYLQKNYSQAIDYFNQAIQLNPNLAVAYTKRGNVYYELGNLNQALQDYNKAIQLDPNYAGAYTNRGLVYYELGNLNQALQDHNKAIQLDPNLAAAYTNRGLVYVIKGDYPQAWQDIERAEGLGFKVPEGVILELERASGRKRRY